MKKLTSLLLCVVMVLSLCVSAAAAGNDLMEAKALLGDGVVTVVVTAKQSTANARLNVTFDPDYLTYEGYETDFVIHSAKVSEDQVTLGLANSSANAVPEGGVLAQITFAVTGAWDETGLTVTMDGDSESLSVTGPGYRFEDVRANQWFYEAVEYMAENGCIKGISNTHFGPGVEMNRAMFVTLLGRLEGIEASYAETRFTDVVVKSFYSGYVKWADEKGIVKGVSDTLFAPTQSVTREQMVTFLYRYVVSEGIDVTVEDPDAVLAQFPDADQVSNFAREAMIWAVDRGVINGMGGELAPKAVTNRAQVAVMLYRFFFEG